ncbi:MAG TPA: RIP metalloprotease RseP [Gemmatimonadales bacterium]|nr:RIP metalloprotease RseP [Gemmatimonadales bacterium]
MFLNANFTLVSILAGVVVLGVLIFVHELGHFLAAKSVGIAVLRFSFGLGPRTPIGVRIGETDYCLSWIPFGGFVKMAGVEEEGAPETLEGGKLEAEVPPERTFDAKPLVARVFVISAGVLMNALFAIAIYVAVAGAYGVTVDTTVTVGAVDSTALPLGAAGLASLHPGDRILRINGDSVTGWDDIQQKLFTAPGTRITVAVAGRATPILLDVPSAESRSREALVAALEARHEPLVGQVESGSPADSAGLRRGDRIVSAGGTAVDSWERLVRAIQPNPGRRMALEVLRDGRTLAVAITPRPIEVRDRPGAKPRTVGQLGIGRWLEVRHFGAAGSVREGLRQAAGGAGLILFTLKQLVTGQASVREIGGPILIGQLAGEVVRAGMREFLAFVALLSVNLAILNLLPIPVLDGGHLVFLLVEGVRGRPLSLVQRQRLTQIGFFVLVGIMVLALSNDVLRLFR